MASLKGWSRKGKLGGCGATLIASRWAVTAAHCIHPKRPILSLVLGEHDIFDSGELDNNRLVLNRFIETIPHGIVVCSLKLTIYTTQQKVNRPEHLKNCDIFSPGGACTARGSRSGVGEYVSQ